MYIIIMHYWTKPEISKYFRKMNKCIHQLPYSSKFSRVKIFMKWPCFFNFFMAEILGDYPVCEITKITALALEKLELPNVAMLMIQETMVSCQDLHD